MNSTKISEQEMLERLEQFFEGRLVPAASALAKREITMFDRKPSAKRESYYVSRDPDTPLIGTLELEDISKLLTEKWDGEDLPELSALSEELAALAVMLVPEEDEKPDVSTFIYAMF